MLKRGNDIDNQLRDITRVKAHNEVILDALKKKAEEEERLVEAKKLSY